MTAFAAFRAVTCLAVLLALTAPVTAQLDRSGEWTAADVEPVPISVDSGSPFMLADFDARESRTVKARADYYAAPGATAASPAPAVVLLHGADGVQEARERRYAREFAGQGVHTVVLDVYRSRERRGVFDRLMNVTPTMAIADAYAFLDWLARQPKVDGDRVALVGFSFGGMAAMQAVFAQVAETMLPDGPRFAAHVVYYAPCITRFEERETTGAPVVLMIGTEDNMVDERACRTFAQDLERGGSDVTIERFEAAHNWDGGGETRRLPSHVANCRLVVDDEGVTRSAITGFALDTVLARNTAFTFCSSLEGYRLRSDEAVRRQSNRALAEFLNEALFE